LFSCSARRWRFRPRSDRVGAGTGTVGRAGLLDQGRRAPTAGDLDPTWAVLVALLVGKVVLHIVIPAGLDVRYVLAGMPCLLLLAAAGLDRIARILDVDRT
jgi:hypothetical protein